MSKAFGTMADQLVEVKIFRQIGFKVLLAWHYLVLFSPLLIGSMGTDFDERFFERQLVLYVTLGVTFAFIALPGRIHHNKGKAGPSTIVMGCIGLVATAISALALFFLDTYLIPITVVLGICEAFLMFCWLRYYQLAVTKHLYRTFAIDMICGALIAFLVCILQYPFSMVAMVLLPVVAALSLIACWKTIRYPGEEPPEGAASDSPLMSKCQRVRQFLTTILPTFVFAFVFGMLQGSYVADETVLLMATNPFIILGITACGIILLVIPEDTGNNASIDTIHHLGMLFFVFGIVGLPLLEDWGFIASETAIMAGFNLFDFGAMAIGISMTKRLGIRGSFFVGGGRSFTYFGLTCGLLVGNGIMQYFDNQMMFSYLLGGVAVLLIVATAMTPFRKLEAERVEKLAEASEPVAKPDQIELFADATAIPEAVEQPSAQGSARRISWKSVCADVAKVYRLSPRETEIFFMVAKGRNAGYIQQKLVISTHTAKTHISNIYHKLGVHSSQEMLNLIEEFRERSMND